MTRAPAEIANAATTYPGVCPQLLRMELLSAPAFAEQVRAVLGQDGARLALEAERLAVQAWGLEEPERRRAGQVLLVHHADPEVVSAALVEPVRRRQLVTAAQVSAALGDKVAQLVERALCEPWRAEPEAGGPAPEGLMSLLESMAEDLRLAVLLVGLRAAELAASGSLPGEDISLLARQTLDFHVPLADRLGMSLLCRELEDLCFWYRDPVAYQELARAVEPSRQEDETCVRVLTDGVRELLERCGVRARVLGRAKGLYSLYRKMGRTGRSLRQITDKIGIRIVVATVRECYIVLGLLHTKFHPIPGTCEDYVVAPKTSGYQSLHTCAYPVPAVTRKVVEFQIRTETMDHQAEFGVAAHWLYKTAQQAETDQQRHQGWLREMIAQVEAAPPGEFLELLRRQMSQEPDGRVRPAVLRGVVSGRKGGSSSEIARPLAQPSRF